MRSQRTSRVVRVQFGLLTGEQWRRFGVCAVTKPNTHGVGDLANTVYDERMGVLDVGKWCHTCGHDNVDCPGHHGYIELVHPVFNIKCLPIVQKIVKCVCVRCGALRVSPEHVELKGVRRLKRARRMKALLKLCEKAKVCVRCGAALPYLDAEGVRCYYDKKAKHQAVVKTPADVLELFDKARRDHPGIFELMGFNHGLSTDARYSVSTVVSADATDVVHLHSNDPKALIFSVLPVIPPCARTWVIRNGDKSDDDLTEKYNNIVKTNRKLADPNHVLTEVAREETIRKLEDHVNTLIDNHRDTNTTGRSHRGIIDRIQGKGNRVQENVMAKRVDQSARTVIASGGPGIRFGEIGVPAKMADILTVPVSVTPLTLQYAQRLAADGRIRSVFRWDPEQRKRTYRMIRTPRMMQVVGVRLGDKVERCLETGDVVLLNRQPTLRKESMIGHRVVVLPPHESVFRIPLAVTTPLGADFDGDECNIHVPQSARARAECATFMSAANRIVTGQRNAPICGIVQDGLVTSYLLTDTPESGQTPHVSRAAFYDALCVAGLDASYDEPALLARAYKYHPGSIVFDAGAGVHRLRGGAIPGAIAFSALLPSTFCYDRRTETNARRPVVSIREGIVLPGSGPLCKKVIGAKPNSIIHVLWLEYGPEVAQEFISNVQIVTDLLSPRLGFSMGLEDCYTRNRGEIARLLTEMDARYGAMDPARQENRRNAELNSAMSYAPKIVKKNVYHGDRNAVTVMRVSGAKASDVNATQMAAFIGQQNVAGKRPPRALAHGTRTLPCFAPGDPSPSAQGFIYGSYLSGQQPHEAFFAAQAGRSGIVDTACKTSETGYIQKKICQKVADLQVWTDGSVRDAHGRVVQFLYGGDGFDPQMLAPLRARAEAPVDFPFFVDPAAVAARLTPVGPGPAPAAPLDAPMVDELLTVVSVGRPGSRVGRQATRNVHKTLRRLLKGVAVPADAIPEFCRIVADTFQRARVPPGEMVGQDLATAMGEITTQLVLSFFHFAGLSLKDASLGVPRFVELLNIPKKPSNVSCVVYGARAAGRAEADALCRELAALVVGDVLADGADGIEMLRVGPDDPLRRSPADFHPYRGYTEPWWVAHARRLGLAGPAADRRPDKWAFRVRLDRARMHRRRTTPRLVADRITAAGAGRFACVAAPTALAELEVWLDFAEFGGYARNKLKKNDGGCVTAANFDFFVARDIAAHFIRTTRLRGVAGVSRAVASPDSADPRGGGWVVETVGGNHLSRVLGAPGVDSTRTISNNTREILHVLGIEAARSFLVDEITRVLSFDGSYINSHHVPLLVDAITCRGGLTPVRRDGIDRNEVGPIAKLAFEQTVNNMIESAVFSEHDNMNGFSARVMFGQFMQGGTGSVAAYQQ
uniref:DNA-directed RNA polymerase subunit n=1 Tax=Marseillevirus LCMAC103 TaxID=2506604 RepID=A0A481YUX8_9VIRU|nr:MAG: DNA-directed RNA polymerase subunit alpha [Marseillevirus LCMAC103]